MATQFIHGRRGEHRDVVCLPTTLTDVGPALLANPSLVVRLAPAIILDAVPSDTVHAVNFGRWRSTSQTMSLKAWMIPLRSSFVAVRTRC